MPDDVVCACHACDFLIFNKLLRHGLVNFLVALCAVWLVTTFCQENGEGTSNPTSFVPSEAVFGTAAKKSRCAHKTISGIEVHIVEVRGVCASSHC